MKKLLKFFASILTISPLATNVVSCSNNLSLFNTYVADKDNNYLIMVDGSDANESKSFHKDIWDPTSKNPDTPLANSYDATQIAWNKFKSQHPSDLALGNANVKFEALEGSVQSKLWDESWATDILKWCGEQSWDYTNPSDKTKNKNYVSDFQKNYEQSTPIFIYLSHGQFDGIETYSDLVTKSTDKKTKKTTFGPLNCNSGTDFYTWAYNIYIQNHKIIWTDKKTT